MLPVFYFKDIKQTKNRCSLQIGEVGTSLQIHFEKRNDSGVEENNLYLASLEPKSGH